MKFFKVSTFLILMSVAHSANSEILDVGCKLSVSNKDTVSVTFTGIKTDIAIDTDYLGNGSINASIVIEGNDNIMRTNGSIIYTKVGNRLELRYDPHPFNAVIIPASAEDFFNHFGSFPKVTCSSP